MEKTRKQPLRVLHVVPTLNKGAGVARFVHNIAAYADDRRVRFDYLHHAIVDGVLIDKSTFDDELRARGSAVYTVNNACAGAGRFVREVAAFMRKHGAEYDVVHCHMPNSAFCVLRDARRSGVSVRIVHSHFTKSSDNAMHRIRNWPLNRIGLAYATHLLACSQDAGRYLFGRRPFTVIRNGIPLEQFSYRRAYEVKLRQELDIPLNAPVVGCVGRLVRVKNFGFALDVFAALVKTLPEARLLVLGEGELRHELEERVARLGLGGSVRMLGMREDVGAFYSLFDCLLMPSLSEGLPLSAVEAQAAGVSCVYSTGVPQETDLLGNGVFLPLGDPPGLWARALQEAIERPRCTDAGEKIARAGYSAQANAEALINYYEVLCERA